MALSRKQREAGLIPGFARPTRPVLDSETAGGIPAVDGTHRTGKRKRGTSVTKVAPVTSRAPERFDAFDAFGVPVVIGANRVDYVSEHGFRLDFPVGEVPTVPATNRQVAGHVENPRVERETRETLQERLFRLIDATWYDVEDTTAGTRAKPWHPKTRDPYGRDGRNGDS